jgi:hypothetical protein
VDKQSAGEQHPQPTSRLVVDVIRALRGWVVGVAGGVFLFGCYLGVSAEREPARQLPYLASGLGGLALVMFGGALLVADQIETVSREERRTNYQVDELHQLIVAAAGAGSAPSSGVTGDTATPFSTGTAADAYDSVFALPVGRTYHRRTCEMISEKRAYPVDPEQIAARDLTACSICDPAISP